MTTVTSASGIEYMIDNGTRGLNSHGDDRERKIRWCDYPPTQLNEQKTAWKHAIIMDELFKIPHSYDV